ncbi:MAG: hypothetical protein H5T34_03320 [Candidatus Methanomethyliales bacterium]|nr:hypothetical protein [Candidatus Methanomethylicales archaeon]
MDNHLSVLNSLMEFCDPLEVTKDQLRDYLGQFLDQPKTYAYHLCGLKRFYRDFLGCPDLVDSFKFPSIIPRPKFIPSKTELRECASWLDQKDLALFLTLASSGARRSEVLTLAVKDVDLDRRMFTPSDSQGFSICMDDDLFRTKMKKLVLS